VRRRDFISLLGGMAVSSPLAAHAQQAEMPVIGLLSLRSLDDSATALQMAAFRRGLKEAGFEENRNVAIEYRWAAGHYDQLQAFAADLVRRKVAVIVAHAGINAVLAAKAATSTIPIVFVYGGDPVQQGVVASLNRPGGNITGVSILAYEILSKRLELLVEIIPNVTAIGLLLNPTNAGAELQLRQTQDAARALGRQLVVSNASTEGDFDAAFATLVQQRAGGIVINTDAFFNTHIEQLVTQTARHMIPAVSEVREFPAAGGLISYGPDFNDANRVVGEYVGRILKGEEAANLPVQRSTKFDLVINLKTAKTLGLTIPLPLLGRADEVIE
jgi:putative tryptophan/tyrosine transport system substrate-binding protein